MKKRFLCALLCGVFAMLLCSSCKPIERELTPYEAWKTYVTDESDTTLVGWECTWKMKKEAWEYSTVSREPDAVEYVLDSLRTLPVSKDRRFQPEPSSDEKWAEKLGYDNIEDGWLSLCYATEIDEYGQPRHMKELIGIYLFDDILVISYGGQEEFYRMDRDMTEFRKALGDYTFEHSAV